MFSWLRNSTSKSQSEVVYHRFSNDGSSSDNSGETIVDNEAYSDFPEKEATVSEDSNPKWRRHGSKLMVLLPSFLVPDDGTPKRKLHPTAWLDGLRGVAAFLVVWHHSSLLWFPWRLHNGWLATEEDNLFIQLPWIRLVISGLPQVMVFFVISGYALSYKPLKLSRQRRFAELGDAIASSAFRRHSRLFIPAVVVSLFSAIFTQLGWYGTSGWDGVAVNSRQPPHANTFWQQIMHWAQNAIQLSDFISKNTQRGTAYDPNFWTLPNEFDCSLVLFLAHAAFSRLRPVSRLGFTTFVTLFCSYYGYWRIFLFSAGMSLCDLHFYLEDREAKHTDLSTQPMPFTEQASFWTRFRLPRAQWFWNIVWTFSFLGATYVLAMPEVGRGAATSPGFATLVKMIPSHYNGGDYFWVPVGAVWLVFTVDRAPFLQRVFMSRFPQYLGKISFSLYLVHGTILYTLGWHAGKYFTEMTGKETNEQYCLGIALAAACFWPVAIWTADLTTRLVDTPAVNLGKWVYDRLTMHGDE